jgi:hypothetical protein
MMNGGNMFAEYESRAALVEAYARNLAAESINAGNKEKLEDVLTTTRIQADDAASYAPHLYRGGWVIWNFGYSTERIGTYVQPEQAGNPALVERR